MADQMKEIAIFYSNRAEKGLLTPVIKRMEESQKITCSVFDLMSIQVEPKDYGKTYYHAYELLKNGKPDIALCSFDRSEIVFVVLAAFHLQIPLAQIHAGDLSQKGAWDDMNRHVISLYADIHFCNGAPSYLRTIRLLETVGRPTKHVYEVGSTALDDVEIDESLRPEKLYDLVLYNPPTRHLEMMEHELDDIADLIDKYTIWIYPNGDPGSQFIIDFIHAEEQINPALVRSYRNLPRPQFLGLMKNCDRFIGNSSSLFCEAPAFLKPHQIIHVGVRNKGREPIDIRVGGSDRIVHILEEIDLGDLR